jgi:outer membrane protein TolC
MGNPRIARLRSTLPFLLLLAAPVEARGQARAPAHVGVVLDGASAFTDSVRAAFEREIAAFFGVDTVVDFPPALRLAADWTPAGARAAIDRLMADTAADLVLALGPIGSDELARRATLPKPAIAALIIDAALQQLPLKGGASGVRNLSYVDVAFTTGRTLEVFHEVVPYRHLAVLLHPGVLDAIPRLRDKARELAAALEVELTFVPVRTSAATALAALPSGTDAVYLGGLEELPAAGFDSLVQGFIARRLPSFSTQGPADVERGVLVSYAPRDDMARLARRVGGTVQRILNGEDAGTLPVALTAISQLTLNMATARAIGFSPSWATMTEARLVHEEAPATGPSWSLARVGEEAARANLEALEADRVVASGRQSVRLSRSALLPQVQGDATGILTKEATAAASLGQQAERQGEASLSFSQYVFSDQTWADYTISRHQQEGREADRRRTRLDVVLRAATAYLDVLRTRAIARVERENVALTRSNLEVAQLKEQAGAGGLSDVYRWQAELAQSRSRVLDADARVQVAALELNSALNRPLEESFHTEDATTDDPALVTSEPRLLGYFGSPATFAVFRDFMVREGIAASPEVQAIDAQIAAQRRVGTAARRSFFLPTLTLRGGLSDVFSRGGAGSEPIDFGNLPVERGPDATWQLQLGASLPLFTGFGRTARAAQAGIDLDRLQLRRQSVTLAVGQQVRASLQLAGASWANIRQAREAAEASRKNLELVTDAYGRGAVNIITLLDAQQAALSANESAANAVYDFLVDLMNVERAVGEFDFFRTADDRAAYFRRLDDFYRAAGVAPLPQ